MRWSLSKCNSLLNVCHSTFQFTCARKCSNGKSEMFNINSHNTSTRLHSMCTFKRGNHTLATSCVRMRLMHLRNTGSAYCVKPGPRACHHHMCNSEHVEFAHSQQLRNHTALNFPFRQILKIRNFDRSCRCEYTSNHGDPGEESQSHNYKPYRFDKMWTYICDVDYTCAIDVKHSSRGNKSLSESGNCCHFAISGGIKISKYLGCKIYNMCVR